MAPDKPRSGVMVEDGVGRDRPRKHALLRQVRWFELASLLAGGLIAGASHLLGAPHPLLPAFLIGAIVYVAGICAVLGRASANALPVLAARYDLRGTAVTGIGVALIATALAFVVMTLPHAHAQTGAGILVAATVVAAWAALHTLFAIHYAHASFLAEGTGEDPFVFPGSGQAVFTDFLYLSFCIGMTFQVADVAVPGYRLRRLVLAHSILSFAMNVFVFAIAVSGLGTLV